MIDKYVLTLDKTKVFNDQFYKLLLSEFYLTLGNFEILTHCSYEFRRVFESDNDFLF